MIAGGIAGGSVWHVFSRFDSSAPLGRDWLTPAVLAALPVALIVFRKPLDALLEPLQKAKALIPRRFVWLLGIMLPFVLAFFFRRSYFGGDTTGQEYEFARKTTVWSTLLTYLLFRLQGGSSPSSQANVMGRLDSISRAGQPGSLLLMIVTASFGFAQVVAAKEPKEGKRTFTVQVGPWTHTGIMARKGQYFGVTAEGSLKFPKDMWGGHTTGPGGFYELGFTSWNLKGKVGEKGRIQELGSSGGISADEDGEVLLAPTHTYEPNPAVFGKITGSFRVVVTGQMDAGPLGSPLGAGVAAVVISALINGLVVLQRPPRKPPGDERTEDDTEYRLEIRTEDKRTDIAADGEERLCIYAQVTCNKPELSTAEMTDSIRFTAEAPNVDWLKLGAPQMVSGSKAISIRARPPYEDAELLDDSACVRVSAIISGEPVSVPVKLQLLYYMVRFEPA